MVKWKHRDGESNMAQINWELHSLTLFQPFRVNWLWVCGRVMLQSKDISLPNQKKAILRFFCFVLGISFDGIVQNRRTQRQSILHGRFRGCMIKFNCIPKIFGVVAQKNKNWQIFLNFSVFCMGNFVFARTRSNFVRFWRKWRHSIRHVRNRGGHVNLPPKLFFSKVKIPKY